MTDYPYCPNFKAIAVEPQNNGENRSIVRLRCKMWTCPYCAAKNRAIWRAKLIHHIAHSGNIWAWFTLTAHSKKRGAQKSIANLRAGWDKLIKRMKRKYGEFSYARIYEKHADGSYHIHAVASINFDDIRTRTSKDGSTTTYSLWLAQTATELKLGFYTHASNVETAFSAHSGFVASYITKYIVKLDTDTKNDFGRIRHIQVSQNWIIKPVIENNNERWLFKFGVYYDDVASAHGKYKWYDLQTKHIIDFEDFDETYIYPPEFADE